MFTCEIDDNNIATIKLGRKSYRQKTVAATQLIAALAGISGTRTPLLPPGTRQYSSNGRNTFLTLEVPSIQRNFKYVNESGKAIVEGPGLFPWELFMFKFQENNGNLELVDERLYAMRGSLIDEYTPLYKMPTPNVFGNSNNICWGNTFSGPNRNLSQIKSVSQAGRFVELFHGAEFNGHLTPRFQNNERMEDVFREMKTMKTYDDKYLTPLNLTYGQALESFFGE